MGFAAAVKQALSRYATFSGRARRSEYWWFALFNTVVAVVVSIVDGVLGLTVFYPLAVLALILPGLAVGVRRLHDLGRSGWWLLIAFVPLVGAILLIVWFCQDSQPQPNAYGPSPKGTDTAGAGTHLPAG
jgi:uncharacterized membrane protein YhaH (DUF805 family)